MSRRERDVLKVLSVVQAGKRTQAEAGRLIGRSERQVRRLLVKLRDKGDAGLIHGLRGRASNHRCEAATRAKALELCRKTYVGFPPTMAAEKLSELHEINLGVETLRGWMLSEGLWQRTRRRDRHRCRRERRECFGEMVLADASEHDWLEGRGPMLTLVGMIDDATDRIVLRFFTAETTEAYMDVLGRWLAKFGRPVSWYTDRHGIFRAEEKVKGYDQKQSVPTQFSRALAELDVELILANSPQAKGRVERLWGTAQDRLVKELRLAKARTLDEANEVLQRTFVPWFNRRCTHQPASANDAHRSIDGLDIRAILCHQETRVVANDYTIRFENRVYQLLPPTLAGQRGGKVTVQKRADGSIHLQFKQMYLKFRSAPQDPPPIEAAVANLGAPPPDPRSLSLKPIPVIDAAQRRRKEKDPATQMTGSITVHRTGGRSGRTPAEPCPAAGKSCGRSKSAWRPAPSHPWRKATPA